MPFGPPHPQAEFLTFLTISNFCCDDHAKNKIDGG